MFLVHGAVVSQSRLKVLERFGHEASHPSESPLLFSLRFELRLLLRLPRLLARDARDARDAPEDCDACDACDAAALPFYHLRAETATEKKKMKKKMTTLSGNTWALNMSTMSRTLL